MRMFSWIIFSLFVVYSPLFAIPTYTLETSDDERIIGSMNGPNLTFGAHSIVFSAISDWTDEKPNVTVHDVFVPERPIVEQIEGARSCYRIRSAELDFGTVHESMPKSYTLTYELILNSKDHRTELWLLSTFTGEQNAFARQIWHNFSHNPKQLTVLKTDQVTHFTTGIADITLDRVRVPKSQIDFVIGNDGQIKRVKNSLNPDTLVYVDAGVVKNTTMHTHNPESDDYKQFIQLNALENSFTKYQQVVAGNTLQQYRAMATMPAGCYFLGQLLRDQPSAVHHQGENFFLVGHYRAVPIAPADEAAHDQVIQFTTSIKLLPGEHVTLQAGNNDAAEFLDGCYMFQGEQTEAEKIFQTWQDENGSELIVNRRGGCRVFDTADISQILTSKAITQTPWGEQNHSVSWLFQVLHAFSNLTTLTVNTEGLEDKAKKHISNGLLDLMKVAGFNYTVRVDQLLTNRTIRFADLQAIERHGVEPRQLNALGFAFENLDFSDDATRKFVKRWLLNTLPNFESISFKGSTFKDGGKFLRRSINRASNLNTISFEDANMSWTRYSILAGRNIEEKNTYDMGLVRDLADAETVQKVRVSRLPCLDYDQKTTQKFLAKLCGLKTFDASSYIMEKVVDRNLESLFSRSQDTLTYLTVTRVENPMRFTQTLLGLKALEYLNISRVPFRNLDLWHITAHMKQWTTLKTLQMSMDWHITATAAALESLFWWADCSQSSIERVIKSAVTQPVVGAVLVLSPLIEMSSISNGAMPTQSWMLDQIAQAPALQHVVLKRTQYIPYKREDKEKRLCDSFNEKRRQEAQLPACTLEFKG